MSSKIDRVVITVDEQNLSSIDSVASTLQSAGLQISNVLSTTGIITGGISHEKFGGLQLIKGVASVELDQEMRAN